MKGLIIKDIMCLKKQLVNYSFVLVGVLVVSVMYVLSAKFGNIARAGAEMMTNELNNLTQEEVNNLGSMAIIMFMLLPIAMVGDMANVFAEDAKAGFYKVAGTLPLPVKKRLAARYITIYALIGIGAAIDTLLAILISAITDMIELSDLLGIIISAASVMGIYSALVIFFCVARGKGREQHAQVFSLLTILAALILLNIGRVIETIKSIMAADEGEGDISGLWKVLDFLKHKFYILFIIAVVVSALSYVLSKRMAERKREVI